MTGFGLFMGMLALCVLCRQHPVDPAWRPFCSRRCQLQDLARWASGAYAIPGEAVPEPQDPENEEGKS
jgi:endogenous inhibitor of DNA gyrase (YacG/DUF329 family)